MFNTPIAILGHGIPAKLLALTLKKNNQEVVLISDFKEHKAINWYLTLNRNSIDTLDNLNIPIELCKLNPIYHMKLFDTSNKKNIPFHLNSNHYNDHPIGFTVNKNTLDNILTNLTKDIPKIKRDNIYNINKNEEFNNYIEIKNQKYYKIANTIAKINTNLKILSKEFSYNQKATIGNLNFNHNNSAMQSFNHDGTLGILPTENPNICNFVLASYEKNLDESLKKHLHNLNIPLNKKYNFDITSNLTAKKLLKNPPKNILAFGDSLRTIHPLAGLGLNLTISDLYLINTLTKKSTNWQYINNIFYETQKQQRFFISNFIHQWQQFCVNPDLSFVRKLSLKFFNNSYCQKLAIINSNSQ